MSTAPVSDVEGAKQYLTKHGLHKVFEQLATLVISERPEDPLPFLAAKINAMVEDQKHKASSKSSASSSQHADAASPPAATKAAKGKEASEAAASKSAKPAAEKKADEPQKAEAAPAAPPAAAETKKEQKHATPAAAAAKKEEEKPAEPAPAAAKPAEPAAAPAATTPAAKEMTRDQAATTIQTAQRQKVARAEIATRRAAQPAPAAANAPAAAAQEKTPPPPNKIVFVLGGPGSGKGTQCARLIAARPDHFVHVSAGDLLREEEKQDTEQGRMVKQIIVEGKIVPGHVTIGLLRQFISKQKPDVIILVDGFPRETVQMHDFETGIKPCEFVLNFEAKDETLKQRLMHRGETSGRSDDNEAAIVKRLATFHTQTKEVLEHFKSVNRLKTVNAEASADEVFAETIALFPA